MPASLSNLTELTDLSISKNKLKGVEGDALAPLTKLVSLDLSQNDMSGTFISVPNSEKLDSILLSFNHLQSIQNLERCPNLTVLDLHNNKMAELPDTVASLYRLKTLTISNNDLSDINPKIAVLDSLVRIALEGNPLRSIKPAMRNAGAVQLKKFLKMRLGDEELAQEEKKQNVSLNVPGAKMQDADQWDVLLREFVVNGTQLDLRDKNLDTISPKLWLNYPRMQMLELSNNPGLSADGAIPEEFALLTNLKSLRLEGCGLKKLPHSILKSLTELQSLDLSKNNFSEFFETAANGAPISFTDVDMPSLTYLCLNGNSLTKVPSVCRYLPNLKQLLLHMNRVTEVNELCRVAYERLEVLDLGGNKVSVIPSAFCHYLKGLCQLTLTNNDVNRLPHNFGIHKSIKNLTVDGNPLKSIRRPIIDGGSARILSYLADKYNDAVDGQVEQWALDQEEADKAQVAQIEAHKAAMDQAKQ